MKDVCCRRDEEAVSAPAGIGRRSVLRSALAAAAVLGIGGAVPPTAAARQRGGVGSSAAPPNGALALARFVNNTSYRDLPPQAIEHAKMILASTFASAASGSLIDSVRILRDLAKESGGRQEATIWFDGTRLPAREAARVNAALSDAAASDDSDIRNTAHEGTTLTSVGLAIGERTGASGQDLLAAMVVGYEAAGRIGDARRGGRAGLHASQVVAFGGAVAAAKLLKLTDDQMAHALGIVATTVGGLATGTNSWAREYMGANAAACGVDAALAAGRGYTVNGDMLDGPGGFVDVFGGGAGAAGRLTADLGKEWDIVTNMAIKLVPGGHPHHATAEAAANAAIAANANPADVARITISAPKYRTLPGPAHPTDLIGVAHSPAYIVAAAVADKGYGWIHASPEKVSDPVIAALIDKIATDPDPKPYPDRFPHHHGATVTITLQDGREFSSHVDFPRGSGPRGIDWADVDAKYRALMPLSKLPKERIELALEVVHDFERVRSVSELTGLLVFASGARN